MTLQRKFAALLTFLGLIVAVNVGTAFWSVTFQQSQLADPLAIIEPVLNGLHTIKRGVEAQGRLLATIPGAEDTALAGRFGNLPREQEDEPPATDPRAAFERSQATTAAALVRLRNIDAYRMRAGTTLANLESRLSEAHRLADLCLQTREDAVRADGGERERLAAQAASLAQEAGMGLFHIHELIEKIEGSVVFNANADLTWASTLRSRLLVILGTSLALVMLAGLLAIMLLRRLVVRPVARLREAAARLSAGDFAHRLPVVGRDEVALLSAEVNHMAGMISTMQEDRVEHERLAAVGEMVRRIVHNLRNPLAGIRSLAELTRAELQPQAASREYQERIVRTVDRFEGWLSGLLRASAPSNLSLTPTALRPWLESCVEPLRAAASAKGLTIEADPGSAPDQAWIDARHLEQVVVSLVTNAIQHAPAGTAVGIALSRCEDGKTWDLRVSDRGPGVPDSLRERIFRPYFTTRKDGTGIGLAIAKQVTEQHGGRIWVEETPAGPQNAPNTGPGATFVIRLPLDGTPQVANTGQDGRPVGATFGQHPDHRRRGEPAVLDPAGGDSSGA